MNVAELIERNMLACSMKNLTGMDCPGCGMQRALVALLKGDLVSSFYHHPALIPFLVTLLVAGLHLCFNFRNGARNIIILFALTCSLMIVNFVVKLLFAQ